MAETWSLVVRKGHYKLVCKEMSPAVKQKTYKYRGSFFIISLISSSSINVKKTVTQTAHQNSACISTIDWRVTLWGVMSCCQEQLLFQKVKCIRLHSDLIVLVICFLIMLLVNKLINMHRIKYCYQY